MNNSGGAPPAGGETLSHRLRRRQPPNGARALRGERLRAGNLSDAAFGGASSAPLSVACGDISLRRRESSPFRGAKGLWVKLNTCKSDKHKPSRALLGGCRRRSSPAGVSFTASPILHYSLFTIHHSFLRRMLSDRAFRANPELMNIEY